MIVLANELEGVGCLTKRNKREIALMKIKEILLERILVATARRITSSHSEQSS